MSELIRLDYASLKVGTPLPWPVYDANGLLLLNKNHVISGEGQLNALITRGAYCDAAQRSSNQALEPWQPFADAHSPFAHMPELCELLDLANQAIRARANDAEKRVRRLARRIAELGEQCPDACLGALHLRASAGQPLENSIYYAVLAHLLAAHLGYDKTRTENLLCAALTANIELQTYQAQLDDICGPLSEAQRLRVNRHPRQAVALLREAGISQRDWLDAISQHHEAEDGSGYPQGLDAHHILAEARIISICEHYLALTRARSYRAALCTTKALGELYKRAGQNGSESLYLAFIKQLSVYPPGTFVLLENGEIALVTHRGSQGTAPLAKAVISPRGGAYVRPFSRNCAVNDYRIKAPLCLDDMPPLNFAELWGFGQPSHH